MLLPVLIFTGVYFFIATELVDKTVAALLGATLVIVLHVIPYEHALHAIDMNVLLLLIGMMTIVGILASTGVFEWMAIVIARAAGGRGLVILALLAVTTAFLSAVLDNVTTVILIAPITILLTQIMELPTVPFLVLEAVFSNIGGTATLVGDPPNIIIGSQTHFSFNDFLVHLGPAVALILLVCIGVTLLFFRSRLRTAPRAVERIARSHPRRAVIEPGILRSSLAVFVLVLLGFFLARPLDVEPGIVAVGGAMLMILVTRRKLSEALLHVEWNTVLFFVGLFIIIAALEEKGVFDHMGAFILDACHGDLLLTAMTILWSSAVFSSIVDNIPLVLTMIPMVKGLLPVFAADMGLAAGSAAFTDRIEHPLFWALALGACLGGNGTLIGASANVVVAQIAHRNDCRLSFLTFTGYGAPYMLISLLLSSAYLYVRYFLN